MKRKGDAEARTRTWDRLVNSEALYQLSYFGSIQGTRFVLIGLSFPPDSGAIGYRTPISPTRRRPIASRITSLAR